jgi:hypothetical protein
MKSGRNNAIAHPLVSIAIVWMARDFSIFWVPG